MWIDLASQLLSECCGLIQTMKSFEKVFLKLITWLDCYSSSLGRLEMLLVVDFGSHGGSRCRSRQLQQWYQTLSGLATWTVSAWKKRLGLCSSSW